MGTGGWGDRRAIQGSETGGAWIGTGSHGKMEGSETGGASVGTGLGREGRWRGARLEARDGSWRGKMEGSETGARKHHKHHCRLLWGSAKVERSMGGGSAAPCFAEARGEVNGAV